MTAPVRYRTAKADVYGYVSELLAKATDQGALDAALTAEDKERLLAFLQSFGAIGGGPRLRLHRHRPPRLHRRPGRGRRRGHARSATPPALSDVFASGVGRYFSFEFGYDQAMLMFQPVGGMDQIPRGPGPGDRRRTGSVLGAEVTGVTDRADGVRSRTRQRRPARADRRRLLRRARCRRTSWPGSRTTSAPA